MVGRTPTAGALSRASSVLSIETAGRDLVDLISDEPNVVDSGSRGRTSSLGSIKYGHPRSRTSSLGSSQSLRRKTLNASLQNRQTSVDESEPRKISA